MEDEIDLSKYFKVLIRHWKLIAGSVIIGAVVAVAVSFLIAPTYEATALVVITRPVYQLQFDPRIPSLPIQQQPNKAYPQLALSDDLEMQVIQTLGDRLRPADRNLAAFNGHLTAEAGADPSVVQLSVSGPDPRVTQLIANTWAQQYVTYTNQIFQQTATQASFFQTQANESRTKLETAEQALIDYQARNPINVINAELSSTQASLAGYLDDDRAITLAIQDARSLQQQWAQQDANQSASLADQLSALYVQVDALSSKADIPIQLQISGGGSLTTRTVTEQAALLTTLINTLQDKSVEIQQQITALKPSIMALQQEQQAAQIDLDRLTRDRDVAQDTYLTLMRKLDETKVAAQDNSSGMQVASQASLPTEPVSPRKGLNAILGAFLGLVIGVTVAFVAEARLTRSQASSSKTARSEQHV